MTAETWTWDPSLFEGAAAHYARGRLPYAPGLAEALRDALGLDGTGRLLDVGCGPGSVTLPFAPLFAEVVGLDPDAGMLAEAARLAAEGGARNCSWVQLRAEELPAGLGTFQVITFAASFHWMDRDRVAATARGMLDPGGAVVHVDNRHQDGTDPGRDAPAPGLPEAAIRELVARYAGPGRRAGQGVRNTSPDREDLVFLAAGFRRPETVVVPDGRLVLRDIDECVHYVFSWSHAAPHLFGERLPEFEAELRALLANTAVEGKFAARLPDNQLVIWRGE